MLLPALAACTGIAHAATDSAATHTNILPPEYAATRSTDSTLSLVPEDKEAGGKSPLIRNVSDDSLAPDVEVRARAHAP